jgi:hypothetical protein
VLSCVGSGLATGWSLVQGVLPIVYKCKITEPNKEEVKARHGLERHWRRRRGYVKPLTLTSEIIKQISVTFEPWEPVTYNGSMNVAAERSPLLLHVRETPQFISCREPDSPKWDFSVFPKQLLK